MAQHPCSLPCLCITLHSLQACLSTSGPSAPAYPQHGLTLTNPADLCFWLAHSFVLFLKVAIVADILKLGDFSKKLEIWLLLENGIMAGLNPMSRLELSSSRSLG